VALRRSLRSSDAGAVGSRRGAPSGGPAGGIRRAQHHGWTADKQALLRAFDESGITGVFMEPAQGGFIEGPKNLALALVAFELA
jgi:hypothetical protein